MKTTGVQVTCPSSSVGWRAIRPDTHCMKKVREHVDWTITNRNMFPWFLCPMVPRTGYFDSCDWCQYATSSVMNVLASVDSTQPHDTKKIIRADSSLLGLWDGWIHKHCGPKESNIRQRSWCFFLCQKTNQFLAQYAAVMPKVSCSIDTLRGLYRGQFAAIQDGGGWR